MRTSVLVVTNFIWLRKSFGSEVTARMKRPVTCRRCGKLIRQGQVMGVWILGNGVVKLQVRYQCPRCHHEGYATLPPEVWAGSKLVWDAPLSELSPEEAERFAQLPPISVDEVLDFYDALKYIDRIPRALLEKLSSHTKTTTKAALSPRYQKRMLHGS
jgi:ribosomal protein L37AE/L43A